MTGFNASVSVSKGTHFFLHVCLDWRKKVKVSQKQKESMESENIEKGDTKWLTERIRAFSYQTDRDTAVGR